MTRTCATCGRQLAPSELYYRFTLVLEGEQDVLDPTGRAGDPAELEAVLQQLKDGPEDARELEDQVHWERAGIICATCRKVVMRALDAPPGEAGSH
jgi:hypothetical protein